MKAQEPAEGIMRKNDFGDAIFYMIDCDCGNPDDQHMIEVEADDFGVNVYISHNAKTNFWSKTRWSHMWKLLTKGYVETQTTTIMNEQTALNYAETLKKAIADVKNFKGK